jgi:dihydrodipicolinate synthase/N-acetylneuraminate lyase
VTQAFALDGVTPIVNTPFTDDLAIDWPSLARLLDRAVADGVVGFIVPAVASEVGNLSDEDRRLLVEAVVGQVGRSVMVIAGVSSDDLNVSIGLTEHALGVGCEAILCRVPDRLIHDEAALIRHFDTLGRVGIQTLMIQDLEWGGPGLSIDSIVRLFDAVPAFRAVKVETSPAGAKYSAIRAATGGELHVSCGWGMGQVIEALDRGVSTFSTTAINLPFVEIHRRYRAGDRAAARALFEEIAPMVIWCQQHIDVSIAFLKRYARAAGLFTTARVREPAGVFDSTHERIADELIELVLGIETRLRTEVANVV